MWRQQSQQVGWGFSVAEVEKTTSLPKKGDGAKVATVKALSRDDRKRGGYQFAKTLGCKGSHLPQKCEMFQGMKPVDQERIIEECNMCPLCMRQEAGQECCRKGMKLKTGLLRPSVRQEASQRVV